MLDKDINELNQQFERFVIEKAKGKVNDCIDNARYAEKTGTSRCVGFGDIDVVTIKPNVCSSYGKIVMCEGKFTDAYKYSCGKTYLDTGTWKRQR